MKYYTILDLAIVPIIFTVILVLARNYQKRMIGQYPEYRYFALGLAAKMVGALAVCGIYSFYYQGGDTLHYFSSAVCFANLLKTDPVHFFEIIFVPFKTEYLSYFDGETGVPVYWADTYASNLAKLIVPIVLLGLESYPGASLLVAAVAFTGGWKLYMMFSKIYPRSYKQLAFGILFIPSLVFWGSGILKDSFTLAAACWYTVSFYGLFVAKRKLLSNAIGIVLAIFVLLSLKPYIFVALLPGSLIWAVWSNIQRIRNTFLRVLAAPVIMILGIAGGGGLWLYISPSLGQYSSIDSMIEKAHVSQRDLKRDYYQGSSFDIGEFDASAQGVISKFPAATVAGLYRPFLWEANNAVMVLSGLENTLLLLITIYFLIRFPGFFGRTLFGDPLLIFALVFSITFAFSVGLSTSNFGALVRFKIPLLPYYVSMLLIIYGRWREKKLTDHHSKYKMRQREVLDEQELQLS